MALDDLSSGEVLITMLPTKALSLAVISSLAGITTTVYRNYDVGDREYGSDHHHDTYWA